MNLPFRLGTTSFIYPGGWLYNVERLGNRFADIEILFFEANGADSLPSARECQALAGKKRDCDLTYSLHTPLNVSLASSDDKQRQVSVQAVGHAIKAAEIFRPEVYIVHVYLGDREHDAGAPTDFDAWRKRATRSLEELLGLGLSARDLCVEVLDYDFRLLEPVLNDLDISVALDIGHLARDGRDELEFLHRYLDRTRVIQWHGVDSSQRDHRSLIHYPRSRARKFLETLLSVSYQGVLTLEVFRESDLEESTTLVESLLAEMSA